MILKDFERRSLVRTMSLRFGMLRMAFESSLVSARHGESIGLQEPENRDYYITLMLVTILSLIPLKCESIIKLRKLIRSS